MSQSSITELAQDPHRLHKSSNAIAVVELVGPAGSGKSTLAREITRRNRRMVIAGTPTRITCLRYLASTTVPYFADYLSGHSRWFTWAETRAMLYLRAWHRGIEEITWKDQVAILDHGPIYRLVELAEFGPELTQRDRFQHWWQRELQRWRRTLDVVVWLDSPTEVLLDRIHQREKSHRCKSLSEAEAQKVLNRYHNRYRSVLEIMDEPDGPIVLQFATDATSCEEIADALLAAVEDSREPPTRSCSH